VRTRRHSQNRKYIAPVFFTPAAVMKYIKHLRNNDSPGPDGIPAEFYKATVSFVSIPLSVVTDPPNGPVLFCLLASVGVVCRRL